MIVRNAGNLKPFKEKQPIEQFKKLAYELKDKIEENTDERMLAHLNEGIAKNLIEEIIPLAQFSESHYPNGTQIRYCGDASDPFDAEIYDYSGNTIDFVEICLPEEGKRIADLNADLVNQVRDKRLGVVDFSHVFDTDRLFNVFDTASTKKSNKDYSKGTLVFILSFDCFEQPDHKQKCGIDNIEKMLKEKQYKAKKVFLFVRHHGSQLIYEKIEIK